MRRAGVVAVVAGVAVAGCGGGAATTGSGAAASGRTATAAPAAGATRPAPKPRLSASRACPNAGGFTCSKLAVPLDHSGRTPGTLHLPVAVADKAGAPVLLVLTGGPGQGGVAFVPRVRARMRALLGRYRLVMIDQRGTGGDALRCPALQRAMGTSDLTVPPASAVESCARRLGPNRRFYSTADTVEDLDALRVALGADKLTLDGTSYGTFVAERYAIAHPDRVAKLVLDSVVPAASLDGLEVDGMRESARVLRAVCRAQHCPGDPAADLAAVVRARHDGVGGPEIYDTLVALSVGAPSFPGVNGALRAARGGDTTRLERLVRAVRRAQRAPAGVLSQGLHAATICADLRPPWGSSSAPLSGREAALRRAAARTDPAPFDRATVIGNGVAQTCLRWPPTPSPAQPRTVDLPNVPTLLLAGDRDLSTPLPWAREQAAHSPGGRLVIVKGSGHSVQSRGRPPAGRQAVRRFLLG
jgi:pimeloyl-ACP methyl ester carboxylesterase